MASLGQSHASRPEPPDETARAGPARRERRRVGDFRIVDDPGLQSHAGGETGRLPGTADQRQRAHLVREFTQLSLSAKCGCDGLCSFVRDHRDRYPDVGHVVDDLFVPAVRLLGQMWCDDDADFVAVTLASHRISLSLMRLEDGDPGPDEGSGDGAGAAGSHGPVLLINAPDDQHGFGLLVVGFHLRRAGWQVEMADSAADLFRRLRQRRFVAVGISAAHDSSLAGAARLIGELRRRAPAEGVRIALGGAAVTNGEVRDEARDADLATDDPAAFLTWLAEAEIEDNRPQEVDVAVRVPQAK